MNYNIYNIWDFFRYDVIRFVKNIWKFRKALYGHYSFDYSGLLKFLEIGITDISKNIEKYSYENDENKFKKIEKMRRAIKILENINNDEIYNLHINTNQMINSMNIGISIKKFFSNEAGKMLESYIIDFLRKENYTKELEKLNLILGNEEYKDDFDAEINVNYYG